MSTAISRRTLASAFPLAALATASSAVAAPSLAGTSEDKLIALGAEFEAAWCKQVATFDQGSHDASDPDGEACDEAFKATMAIVARIERTTATSLAGVIIKARACSWCHAGELFDRFSFGEHATTDRRLAATIIRDLMAISGKPTPES